MHWNCMETITLRSQANEWMNEHLRSSVVMGLDLLLGESRCIIDESQRQECVGIGESTYMTVGRTMIKITLAGSLVLGLPRWQARRRSWREFSLIWPTEHYTSLMRYGFSCQDDGSYIVGVIDR
ncbi:hypothetical protein PHMEG_00013741 [Phytophthora megakarya]|uniref:Uncharacterized protein n=1 Tax=Phytophthora megakarya TaxID=4795 RepID=A0A225W5I4_9STRA|nr:hypothetical protein PHMEG_00013741 [Phytophthora megakarya]